MLPHLSITNSLSFSPHPQKRHRSRSRDQDQAQKHEDRVRLVHLASLEKLILSFRPKVGTASFAVSTDTSSIDKLIVEELFSIYSAAVTAGCTSELVCDYLRLVSTTLLMRSHHYMWEHM